MLSRSWAIFIPDRSSNFKLSKATLLGKLFVTFEFEAAILDIYVTEVTKVICCFQNLVYSIEPKLLGQS